MSDDYPTTDGGELNYEQMVEDLGLGDVSPANPTFVAGETGEVMEVTSIDIEVGKAYLRDSYDGRGFDEDIAELWGAWMWDDLMFRRRVFLRGDQVVVSRRELACLADEVNDAAGGQETNELERAVGHAYEVLDCDHEVSVDE
ncbi:hypothetical protein HUG10_21115 (plasmid) [Halorarum halophilum]|uniref:Uncharacterized protein n=1 Tax=Halorarum halophilum TaxID=2743090 RepID=A0A7D5H045_9EURY|nr:hypothetical protein [Halobaculum halophilum]QLG30089.1 hypothetical protein HUG10_21115 [Halobaculum halophilum]